MALLGGGSVSSRRTIVGTLFAAVMFAAVAVQAQDPAAPPAQPAPAQPADPAAQQPAPAAPAAPAVEDIFKVTADEAGWLWYVKPEKEMDFQATWREIKAKLATAENPELKTLGDNLTIYKIDVPAGAQGVQYLFLADPASKTLSYSASPFLLFESKLFPDADGRRLFDVLQASVNGIGPFPLKKLQ